MTERTVSRPRWCASSLLIQSRHPVINRIPFRATTKLFAVVTTNSSSLRRQLSITKLNLSQHISNTSSVLTFILLLIFTAGLETAVRDARNQARSSLVPLNTGAIRMDKIRVSHKRPKFQWQSDVMRELHDNHALPSRFLKLLSKSQQLTLYHLVSTSIPNSTIPRPKRRVIIAHITDCHLQQCLRAIATAITYAQVTLKVALIFVDYIADTSITSHIRIPSNDLLVPHALVIPVTPSHSVFMHNASETFPLDWAELSVVTASITYPVPTPQFYIYSNTSPSSSVATNAHPIHPSSQRVDSKSNHDRSSEHEDDPDDPVHRTTIGNTNTPATFDNLAAMDTHVFVTLSEVFWSRYAPRSLQEGFLHEQFQAASTTSESALMSASLLGRHKATRSISDTDAKLHDEFNIPHMLLRGMSTLARKLLLLKLQTKLRKGISDPTAIFVHTQYGLGNRLRALGSAMAFARRTKRVLVLIWVPDQHLNCRYTDLFVANDEFIVADAFRPEEPWPFSGNSRTDSSAMARVKWYNYMRVNGVKILDSVEPVIDQQGFHLYVATCYVIQSPVTPFIIRTTSSFWSVLKSLTPHVNVAQLVDRFESYPVSKMIGIHIRGKSIKTDISGVDSKEYTEESSRTTDYWRNLTQVDTFVEEMKRQTVDQLFYVAADQKEVFDRLEHEFPSRVFYTPRNCDSRESDCLPFALADILLLAKCASLRGSYWSSFSELSTRIGGARFLLAGVDFGRP